MPERVAAPPNPRAAGEIAGCTFWQQVFPETKCRSILDIYYLTIEQFYKFNPSIKPDCSALAIGTYYCVSIWPDGLPPPEIMDPPPVTGVQTPSPVQTGMVTDCDKFYKVKSGDGCAPIAEANGISVADFYAWNPAVGSDCRTLQADVYVCVHTSSSKGPTTTTTKAPDNSTPTPTQPGMTAGCTKFYKVKSGDGCWQISHDNNVDLNDFYSWNPAVKNDCTGLLAGVYVCVSRGTSPSRPTSTTTTPANGIATPTPTQAGMISYCSTFYKVKSGDGCWQIAHDNKIDLNDFYAWNPAVGNDCRGLQANVYVCTGVVSFHIRSHYHSDCTGDVHNDIPIAATDDTCINTDCKVASLEVLAEGACPDGQVQISYWEKPNCQGQWYGYGYANRGSCRSLWTNGYKWKSL